MIIYSCVDSICFLISARSLKHLALNEYHSHRVQDLVFNKWFMWNFAM